MVSLQYRFGCWRQLLWNAVLFAEKAEIMVKERLDVLRALGQRWNVQFNDVKPVVQVGAKQAGFHLLLKVLVGGGNDADIERFRFTAADALYSFLPEERATASLARKAAFLQFHQAKSCRHRQVQTNRFCRRLGRR